MQVSYDTVLGIALNHCGLPPRVDSGGNSTLSHSLWDSFRIWINNRLYSYWNRVDLPFNRIEKILTVKQGHLLYDQTIHEDASNHIGDNIGRILSLKKDGCDVDYQLRPDIIYFGDANTPDFDVSITYIKQPPVFSNQFTEASHESNLEAGPFSGLLYPTPIGANAFATDDGHYYQVSDQIQQASTTPSQPGESGDPQTTITTINLTRKLDIPEELADILGHAVAADFFHRNENQQQSRSHEARAELIWTQRLQQLITATPQRKRRKWIAADR